MKNIAFAVFVAMLVAFEQARAGSIEWQARDGQIELSNGDLAPLGNAVRLGTFDPDFNFQNLSTASFNTYSEVNGNGWTEWDSQTLTFMNGFFFPKTFQTVVTNVGQVYIWAFNDSDPDDASEWGIVTDPSWISPSGTTVQIITDVGGVVSPSGYIWGSASTNLGLGSGPNLRMEATFSSQNEFIRWVPQMSNTVLMTWATDPGVGYQVQQESGLTGTQNWVDFGSEAVAVSNEDSRVITLDPNEDKSFYRVMRME